jgi:hypothetical protein
MRDGCWALAAEAQAAHPEEAEARRAAAALRERWLAQEVEEKPEGGCPIKEGREKDRVVRVADPEMRHGPRVPASVSTGTRGRWRSRWTAR